MSGSYLRETRSIELSTIKYLETQINASWTGITILKTFPQSNEGTLPIVCIYLTDTFPDYREIGSTTLMNDYNITIQIFAKSDGQRLDLADFILNCLKDPWTYYTITHASGSESLSYSDSGKKIRTVEYVNNTKIDQGDDVDPYERFRHSITITVRKF